MKCPIFPISTLKWEKWGISNFFSTGKWGISKKKHVTSFKTGNEPKIKVFEFGAFQKIMHMASREEYIFHMLFGAFHDTPRIMKSVCLSLYWNQSNCSSDKNYKEHETTLDIQYSKLIYILYSVPHSASYRHLMLFARFRYDWNSKFSSDIFDGFFILKCWCHDWIFDDRVEY